MSTTERVGLSMARLALLDRVLKEKYVDSGAVPNALVQVWRRGELVHQGMSGITDLERGTPVREDTIFRIYSMTKPITAVALLMMIEEGKVDLEDEVATFIPAFKDLGVYTGGLPGAFRTKPPRRPMRIIDLATHTAGLTYHWKNATYVDAAYREANFIRRDLPGGLGTFVGVLARTPLDFSPGEHWSYGVGMDVLASIIEQVSGLRYGDFLQTRIFKPLGMTETAHQCPPEKIGRLATYYQIRDGRMAVYDDDGVGGPTVPASLTMGGSGLFSTAGDYMRFCRMLLGRGALDGNRILSPKSVAMLSANMLPGGRTISDMEFFPPGLDAGRDGMGQSLCVGVTLDPAKMRNHGSVGDFHWSGAAMTQFWVDPAEDLAVVFMTQVNQSPHHSLIPRVLRSLVYGAMTESNLPPGRGY